MGLVFTWVSVNSSSGDLSTKAFLRGVWRRQVVKSVNSSCGDLFTKASGKRRQVVAWSW